MFKLSFNEKTRSQAQKIAIIYACFCKLQWAASWWLMFKTNSIFMKIKLFLLAFSVACSIISNCFWFPNVIWVSSLGLFFYRSKFNCKQRKLIYLFPDEIIQRESDYYQEKNLQLECYICSIWNCIIHHDVTFLNNL